MYNFLFILVNILFWIDGFLAISMLYMGQNALALFLGLPFAVYCSIAIPVGLSLSKEYLLSKIRERGKYQY